MNIIIIGGGAAGFFSAINIAKRHPSSNVTLLEKRSKLLSKVKVSGGGRCNVTNQRTQPSELVRFYPRGNKKLHSTFKQFSTADMVGWLHERGVATKAEADLRMFPVTDSSQTVIDCFLSEAQKYQVTVETNCGMTSLKQHNGKWRVETSQGTLEADKVIIATGSSPAIWKMLGELGLEITPAVPSLFTFHISDPRIEGLQGISFEQTAVKIVGTKLNEEGPLLITHWGLSGPAVLKLSAWGAYELHERNYQFELLLNFVGLQPEATKNLLLDYKRHHPKQRVVKYPLFDLPRRFWERMVDYCGIAADQPFQELAKKQVNKLIEELTQGRYQVTGKSMFKDEFVTAGGVKLSEINLHTFECKRFPNLYLAGEVLDIDALTGGFNFQACWSAGWVISENIL